MRRLIADEVRLGKTLQAGIILKTRLNQGKAARALVIAPKSATGQWQSELLMKFAVNARIIDAQVQRYRDGRAEPAAAPPWNAPLAIAGSQWLVRNAERFLQTCGNYDFIIVDEAHRARFRDVDHEQRRRPNQYLKLLNALSRRTRELLLLTATPMQLNEVELWALLKLLAPEGWNEAEYRRFHQSEPPDPAEWKYRRDLWLKTGPPDTGDFLLASDNDDYLNAAGRIPQDEDDLTILMYDADLDDADLDELAESEPNPGNLLNRANLDLLLQAADEADAISRQDTKRQRLGGVIRELRRQGHRHILLFTQFRDTQSWLAGRLRQAGHYIEELYGQDHQLGDRGPRLEKFSNKNGAYESAPIKHQPPERPMARPQCAHQPANHH